MTMPARSNLPKSDKNRRAVGLFLAYLTEVPLAAWVEAARRRALIPEMAEAELALQARARDVEHAAQVFAVKEGVLRALQQFETVEGRHLTRFRYATEHLRPATENAALAVLLRPSLSPEHFATLYAPFESVIPVALLFGIAE